MVSRVKTRIGRFGLPTANNPLGTAISGTWRFNGVFTVKPAFCRWKQSLAVAEYRAILFVRKRATLMNSLVGLLALLRQFGNFDRRQSVIERSLLRVHAQRYDARCDQHASKH